MCYEESQLLAYLDEQLSPRESRLVEAHLKNCRRCREVMAQVSEDRDMTTRCLTPYHQAVLNLPVGEPRPFSEADRARARKGAVSWMRRYYKWVAAVAAVVAVFSFTPASSLAAQFLNIFRVEKVQVVHLNAADLAQLGQSLENQQSVDIDNFGKIDQKPLENADYPAEQRLPKQLNNYSLVDESSQPGTLVSITAKVDGINQFLRDLGGKTMLPQELDGKTFHITVPKLFQASYRQEGAGLPSLRVAQTVSPVLEGPPGVDMRVVRDAMLDIPLLPENMKSALKGMDDWTKTLPVPDFDRRAGEINLDGAPGLFVQGRERPDPTTGADSGSYFGPSILAWYRNGYWTILEGQSSMTKQEAFDLARQLENSLW